MNTDILTPRTDAVSEFIVDYLRDEPRRMVEASFARQLERELELQKCETARVEAAARDEAERIADAMISAYAMDSLAREAEMGVLITQVRDLKEALKPFAALLNWADIDSSDADEDAFLTGTRNAMEEICGAKTTVITVGDIRRAAALLKEPTP